MKRIEQENCRGPLTALLEVLTVAMIVLAAFGMTLVTTPGAVGR